MKNIWRLLKLIPNYRRQIVSVLLMNGFLGLFPLAIPFLYRSVVNNIVAITQHPGASQAADHGIVVALVLLMVFMTVSNLLQFFQERRSDLLFTTIHTTLREQVFAHLINVSIDYYEQTRVGEITERVGNGNMELARWIYSLVANTLTSVLSAIFIMVLLWIKFPLVALIMTLGSVYFVWNSVHKVKRTRPIRKIWLKQNERLNGQFSETISQISTIRSFGQDHTRLADYRQLMTVYRQKRIDQFRVQWYSNFWREAVMAVAAVGSFAAVTLSAVHGHASAGDVLLVSLYLQTIRSSLFPITQLITDTGDVESSSERVTQLLDIEPTVVDSPDAVPLTEITSIEFKAVSFRYPGKKASVLNNVSFKIAPGQTLALVGPSGVGKSTITKLLLRFYEPTEGAILINGQDIRNYQQDSLRQLVGMVMQDVALFNDTIKENLRFANPKATTAELTKAAEQAHAAEFIEKLPEKYQTLVGERGIKLSGGQKQRIAIARAILRKPQLIILDEATSALDSESEQYVQDGLRQLMTGRTAIIIAHRLSTVMQADQIVVLKDGKVIERGDHAKLVNQKSGLYARLFSLQQGGKLR